MIPQYVREKDNLPSKLFREDFYTAAPELEICITEILADNKDNKDLDITVRMVKNKAHELLFNEGMGAFKNRKASAEGKRICKEMFPEFYGEMKDLPTKQAAPKQDKEEKKTVAKKAAKPDTKKETPAPAAPKKKTSASAPGINGVA